MKKIVLLTALAAITGSTYAQSVYNLDFEDVNSSTHLPNGWGLGNVRNADIPTDKTLGGFKIDDHVRHHGRYSLLIDWSKKYSDWTASNYVIRKSFRGKKIVLTGYIKTENVTDGAGLWMRLDGKDYKNLGFDNMQDRFVKGTTDWKQYTIELPYDEENVKSIVVGGLIEGEGKMWMDDLQIKIDDKDLSEAVVYTIPLTKPETDSVYNYGSGISDIVLYTNQVQNLTNLGMLWGFLKYYHAGVQDGNYNMDAQLFRVLPSILATNDVNEANAIMEKWVDGFGKPDSCPTCKDLVKTDTIKLMPDYGYLFARNNLPQTLIDKLNYIKRNRSVSGKHYYIDMDPSVGNPTFTHELPYTNKAYPDAGVRLLALYRYWNIIQYFFPDRHLIGEDWNKVLGQSIPEFCAAKDTLAYQVACVKLISRIHDSHGSTWGGSIEREKGKYMLPFRTAFVENKLVVSGFYKDTLRLKYMIKPGDVIEEIDDVPVNELIKKYLPVTTGSNFETQMRDMIGAYGYLSRGKESNLKLTISRNGIMRVVRTKRIKLDYKLAKHPQPDSAYKVLDGNIGYIYPALLTDKDINHIKDMMYATKGIVIDMRCYPTTFMPFTYGAWFKEESSPFVKFTGGSTDFPGCFETSMTLVNGGGAGKHYKGKLVIIVNEQTQSQAEYTTMALGTTPGCKVIGSTTAGADGNVSEIILPGGMRTMISGLGVLYPDGSESQRCGVKIDKVVKPTIKGVQQGRDEPLEEAIRIIKG